MFEEMWWGKVGESVASTQTLLHHTPTILRQCPLEGVDNTPTILRHCPLEGVAKPAVKTTQLSQFSIIHSKPQ